jgi:hypothetical protein
VDAKSPGPWTTEESGTEKLLTEKLARQGIGWPIAELHAQVERRKSEIRSQSTNDGYDPQIAPIAQITFHNLRNLVRQASLTNLVS